MSVVKRAFALFLLVSFLVSHAETKSIEKKTLDITYKNTPQGVLKLDLYYPNAPHPGDRFPLVIFTHGGGWSASDKSLVGVREKGANALLSQGFCVASVDYRLCGKDSNGAETNITIRDCVTDSKDALRFLAKNAERFFIDTGNVFTFGDSAGGQIAQVLLLSPQDSFPGDPALAGAQYRLVAGVSWYGPCDFEKKELFSTKKGGEARDRFGGRIYKGEEDSAKKLQAYREVSSVNYLAASSPPLLMIQGDQDTTIPVHHAHYMKERADALKAPVEILIIHNSGHNWKSEGGPISPSVEEIVSRTADFLKQHLTKVSKE